MSFSTGWGASGSTHTSWTSYGAGVIVYRPGAFSLGAGQPDLDGNSRVYLHGLSASASGASHVWGPNSGSGWHSAGASIQANLLKTGSGTLNFPRNSGSGGTIHNTVDGTTWAGNFVSGSYQWSTAPAVPGSISVEANGDSVEVSFTAADNGGGETITGYTAQYRKDNGSWTGDKTVASVTPITFDDLDNGSYEFRVFASTALGGGTNGAAKVSSAVDISSGGKRKDAGDGWVDTVTFKRKDSEDGWVDISTFKRKDSEDGWVDGGSS